MGVSSVLDLAFKKFESMLRQCVNSFFLKLCIPSESGEPASQYLGPP